MHLGMVRCRAVFTATVTFNLTSDQDFRIIMTGVYPLYYLRLESQIWYVNASWEVGMGESPIPFLGHCDLELWHSS